MQAYPQGQEIYVQHQTLTGAEHASEKKLETKEFGGWIFHDLM